MSDEFSIYERGLDHLSRQLVAIPQAYQEILLLQLRLERNIAEARKYGSESTQKSELNKLLDSLNDLSLQNTGKSFNEWCKWHPPIQPSTASEEIQHIEQYTGNLENMRTKNIYQEFTDQLIEMGAKPKEGKKTPQEDILERYIAVPLHAIFLYTSQDEAIAPYILDHWGALDTLSGTICDIHPTVDQFNNIEDAYDHIEQLNIVKDANFRFHSKLPGLFFWDHKGTTEYIPFGSKADSSDITYIIRFIFEHIHHNPVIASVTHAKDLLERR